jgi:hypothetical protein
MSEFRVPTVPLPVELRCDDGRRLVGDVFMPAHSSRHHGAMRPDEWANSVALFFPFRPYEGQCRTIINRRRVVAITVGADANTGDDQEGVGVPESHVSVEAAGHCFQGSVRLDMPRNQQRVVDLLNAPEPFVTVRSVDRHYLVHKEHITRVLETHEE